MKRLLLTLLHTTPCGRYYYFFLFIVILFHFCFGSPFFFLVKLIKDLTCSPRLVSLFYLNRYDRETVPLFFNFFSHFNSILSKRTQSVLQLNCNVCNTNGSDIELKFSVFFRRTFNLIVSLMWKFDQPIDEHVLKPFELFMMRK